jgi:hypothetical protein
VKVHPGTQDRRAYFDTQIDRSNSKFSFCKVAIDDVAAYRAVIVGDLVRRRPGQAIGPLLCLGTRSGREVDLFRVGFFGGSIQRRLIRWCERSRDPFTSYLPIVEGGRRSQVDALDGRSAIGVEINPRGRRCDVWTGSFDEMPAAWSGRFGVVYSNSFDQSQDPYRTAKEWRRVLRPGGYLIFCFAEGATPTATDPVGDLRVEDVLTLFAGEMVFHRDRGSRRGYSEVIVRMPDGGAAEAKAP